MANLGKAVIRVITGPAFLVGALAGILAVAPKILLQYGVMIGNYGETWFIVPGTIAYMCLLIGVFETNAAHVYEWVAIGVIANGLAYAGGNHVLMRLVRRVRRTEGNRETGSNKPPVDSG